MDLLHSTNGIGGRTHMLIAVFTSLVLLASCGPSSVAQIRAANDMSCPQDQVEVTSIGGTSFKATGCGQTIIYNCEQSSTYQGTTMDYSCAPESKPAPIAVGASTAAAPQSGAAATVTTVRSPAGAGGFAFGTSPEVASSACEQAGYQWSSVLADSYACSGTASDIGMPAVARLHFLDNKLVVIALVVTPDTIEKALQTTVALREALVSKYREPAESRSDVPSTCSGDALGTCLFKGLASIEQEWKWKTGVSVILTAKKPKEEGPVAVTVTYTSRGIRAKVNAL